MRILARHDDMRERHGIAAAISILKPERANVPHKQVSLTRVDELTQAHNTVNELLSLLLPNVFGKYYVMVIENALKNA